MKLTTSNVLPVVLGTTLLLPTVAWSFDSPQLWATKDNALKDASYGSTGFGAGKFKLTDNQGTVAKSNGQAKIRNADDHKVFTKMQPMSNAGKCKNGTSLGFQFLGVGADGSASYSCTQDFYAFGRTVTSEISSSATWAESDATANADSRATSMRAEMWVCLDIPSRPDTCSDRTAISGRDTLR